MEGYNVRKSFKPGEVIIRERTQGNSAYIIESGRVEVSRNIGNQRIVFTELDKGSIFGEMCLIDNSPRSATVTAVENTTVSVLSKAHFQQFITRNAGIKAIFAVFAERLRETDNLVNPLKLSNFYFSLCSLVYYLARAEGGEGGNELLIDVDFLVERCCMILAVNRQVTEKVLNRLVLTRLVGIDREEYNGIVRRTLVIHDQRLFKDFTEFLEIESADREQDDSQKGMMSEKLYSCLKVLVENMAEYQPSAGRNSVPYGRYLETCRELLNISADETDKLIRPLFDSGLFKQSMDTGDNIRQLTCSDPGKLDSELENQASLRKFARMANLLKSLASN